MAESENISTAVYDLRYAKPLDRELICDIAQRFKRIITVEDGYERWETGDLTLFERTESADGSTWLLTLPETDYGQFVECRMESAGDDTTLTLTVTEYDPGDVFSFTLQATGLPEKLPYTGSFDVTIDAVGRFLPQEFHLHFSSISDGQAFILTHADAATGDAMLTVSGSLRATEAPKELAYQTATAKGCMDILSVNDASLSQFLGRVISPLVQGAWPLLVQMPASTFTSIFDLLEQYNVLGMIIYSLQ